METISALFPVLKIRTRLIYLSQNQQKFIIQPKYL